MKPSAPPRVFLTCPDCSEESLFPEAMLMPGEQVVCPHCGTELLVSHDRDTPDGPPIWRLEIPEPVETRPAGV